LPNYEIDSDEKIQPLTFILSPSEGERGGPEAQFKLVPRSYDNIFATAAST